MRNNGNVVIFSGLDNPRFVFNGGYHDARFDTKHETVRKLLPHGKPTEHDIQHVCAGYNPYYYHGYKLGLQHDEESSRVAWLAWLKSFTSSDLEAVRFHVFVTGLVEHDDAVTDHAIAQARRWTQDIMETQ